MIRMLSPTFHACILRCFCYLIIRQTYATSSPVSRYCREGYTKLSIPRSSGGVLCIKAYENYLPWGEAQQQCHTDYSFLLTLDDVYISHFGSIGIVQHTILDYLSGYKVDIASEIWASLRVNSGGKLSWDSHVPFDYHGEVKPVGALPAPFWQWGDQQPDRRDGLCAKAELLGGTTFNVSLVQCHQKHPFLCVSGGFSGFSKKVSRCRDGWSGSVYADKCYKHILEQTSIEDARQKCQQEGSDLAQPSSDWAKSLLTTAVHVPAFSATELGMSDQKNQSDHSLTRKKRDHEGDHGRDHERRPEASRHISGPATSGAGTCGELCENGGKCDVSALGLTRCACPDGYYGYHCQYRKTAFEDLCAASPCLNGGTCTTVQNSISCACEQHFSGGYCEIDERQSPCFPNPCHKDGQCRHTTGGFTCFCKKYTFGTFCDEDFGARGECRRNPCQDNGECYESWRGDFWCNCTDGYVGDVCDEAAHPEEADTYTLSWTGLIESGKCVAFALGVYHPGVTERFVDCQEKLNFACEMNATINTEGKIISHPSDVLTRLGDVATSSETAKDWGALYKPLGISLTLQTVPLNIQTVELRCEAEGYHPEREVVWIKDGARIKKALPPEGFVLNVYADNVHTAVTSQGHYHCELWANSPFTKMVSNKALVQFADVLTFQGSLSARNLSYQTHMEGAQRPRLLYEMMGMLVSSNYPLNYYAVTGVGRGSLIVNFTVYHVSPQLSRQVILWNATEMPYSRTYHTFYMEYLNKQYTELKEGMVNLMSDINSDWHKKYHVFDIPADDLVLLSTDYCFGRITPYKNRLYMWETTGRGSVGRTEHICVYDGFPMGKDMCIGSFVTGALWDEIHWLEKCPDAPFSPVTMSLRKLSETPVDSANVESIAFDVQNLTADPTILSYPDVIYTAQVLDNLAGWEKPNFAIGRFMVQAANHILQVHEDKVKKAQNLSLASTKVVNALSNFARKAVLPRETESSIKSTYIGLHIVDSPTHSDTLAFSTSLWDKTDDTKLDVGKFSFHDGIGSLDESSFDSAVVISPEAIRKAHFMRGEEPRVAVDNLRVTYMVYEKGLFFLTPSDLANKSFFKAVNSRVISATVDNLEISNLQEPVRTLFRPTENTTGPNACVFWDFSAHGGLGNWSTEGCHFVATSLGLTYCQCDHLTNFAILTDFERKIISENHLLALSIISSVGLGLSILGLFMTIVAFAIFKKLRSSRSQKTLFNLAISLLCVDVIFLAGIDKTKSYVTCVLVAAFLHYFLLAAFMWMLIEGILQYIRFVRVFDKYIYKFTLKVGIPAWGIPAVIVGVVAAVDYDMYRGPANYCWLSLSAFYYAFLIPVAVILLTNLLLFTIILRGFCTRKSLQSTQKKSELTLLQVRATLVCLISMGLTWVFGFVAVNNARILFQYLFCIFNAFQGFYIFLLLNVRERKVRAAWKEICCCQGDTRKRYVSGGHTQSTSSAGTKSSGKTRIKSASLQSSSKPEAHYYDNSISEISAEEIQIRIH